MHVNNAQRESTGSEIYCNIIPDYQNILNYNTWRETVIKWFHYYDGHCIICINFGMVQ